MAPPDTDNFDPAIVAAIYLEHGDEVRRFLVGLLRDHQLAADVLQTTFARLIEHGSDTADNSRKAWLFRVAFNEAMAVRRRQSVGDKVVRRMAWGNSKQQGLPEESMIRLESVERIREAMAALPQEQQRVVRMRIYEEKKFTVIAEELNIPLGTALGRMRDALAKLRKSLEE